MKKPAKTSQTLLPAVADTPEQAFAHLRMINASTAFVGVVIESPVEGEFRLADRDDSFISCRRTDVLFIEPRVHGLAEVLIAQGAQVWRTTSISRPSALDARFLTIAGRVDEENIPQPLSIRVLGDPTLGEKTDQNALTAGVTIQGAAKVFTKSCEGGGSQSNNCAHYLSNAFIKAGFTDFDGDHDCVEARCSFAEQGYQKCSFTAGKPYRVTRAKDLRCWFKEKATSTATTVSKNTGFWAAYQEQASNGQGHVAIIDTNKWLYYGTGWYSAWSQEYYKW